MLRSFSPPASPARGINKDPPVWLDGARPPPKYVFKNNMSWMNSKIEPTLTPCFNLEFLTKASLKQTVLAGRVNGSLKRFQLCLRGQSASQNKF
jgi:hypothetical protein